MRPSPQLKAAQDAYLRASRRALDAATRCGMLRREMHRDEMARDRFELAHARYIARRRELEEAGERLREAEKIERDEGPASDLSRLIRDVWRQSGGYRET